MLLYSVTPNLIAKSTASLSESTKLVDESIKTSIFGFIFLKLFSFGTSHADAKDGSEDMTKLLLFFFDFNLLTVRSICLNDIDSSSKPMSPICVIFKFVPLPVNNFSPIVNSNFSTNCCTAAVVTPNSSAAFL